MTFSAVHVFSIDLELVLLVFITVFMCIRASPVWPHMDQTSGRLQVPAYHILCRFSLKRPWMWKQADRRGRVPLMVLGELFAGVGVAHRL